MLIHVSNKREGKPKVQSRLTIQRYPATCGTQDRA